ncbi:MAG: carboxypeptidase-like regulatory domain-containing protein [Melioribacteraceae bacterium]|nr:carboxypeptidase-like regulatory domain-containing protein [Melioribacteraceae bacterium]
MKQLFLTALIITTLSAQTVSINLSGRIEDANGSSLTNAAVIVEQYTNPDWQFRGSSNSNQQGEFSIPLNNVTSVENSQTTSPVQFISLKSRYLESPVKTLAEIKVYNLLGEEVPQQIQEIEISAGRNIIPDPIVSNLTSGIYIRRITLLNGSSKTQNIII